MPSHRRNKSSAKTAAAPPAGQVTAPAPSDETPAVDSRAYAYAYLIREPAQLPADFDVEQDFDCGLFLPRESVPRFELPRYVPRVVLLWPDRLTVHSHPGSGLVNITIRLSDVCYVELERFMAQCSLTFFMPGSVVPLPFHGRDEEHVGSFLEDVQQRLLSGGKPSPLLCRPQVFGPEPGYKFKQIEAIMRVDPERVVSRFVVPPKEVVRPKLFGAESLWTLGYEILLTQDQMYLFSDDKDGYRQLYGFRATWAPLGNMAEIALSSTPQVIEIKFQRGRSWNIPVPGDLRGDAGRFVSFVKEAMQNRQR
jgi:hypothetical protein